MAQFLVFVLAALTAADEMSDLPGPNGITLRDAREFGIPPLCIEGVWRLARDHQDWARPIVQAWNPPDRVCLWEQECEWRTASLDQLDNVLRCSMDYRAKMRCLARFRELIGEEAYMRREAPSPLPLYKGRP